jgi:hypothetical protein
MKIYLISLVFVPFLVLAQAPGGAQNKVPNGCVAVRDAETGEISRYDCEHPKLQVMHSGKMEKIGIHKMKVMKSEKNQADGANPNQEDDTVEKAMERYNTVKKSGKTQLEYEKQTE